MQPNGSCQSDFVATAHVSPNSENEKRIRQQEEEEETKIFTMSLTRMLSHSNTHITHYTSRHVGMKFLNRCCEWISSEPNISQTCETVISTSHVWPTNKFCLGVKCWLGDRTLRSTIGVSDPRVLQKKPKKNLRKLLWVWRGRKSEGQVKSGQHSSSTEPYEGWLSPALAHTHTHALQNVRLCMFPSLLTWCY